LPGGGDTEAVAAMFKNTRRDRVAEMMDTLVGLGQASWSLREATGYNAAIQRRVMRSVARPSR